MEKETKLKKPLKVKGSFSDIMGAVIKDAKKKQVKKKPKED